MRCTTASVKAETVEPRDAPTKLTRQRLSLLELAAELGNAAEVGRQRGMDWTSLCYTSGAGEPIMVVYVMSLDIVERGRDAD